MFIELKLGHLLKFRNVAPLEILEQLQNIVLSSRNFLDKYNMSKYLLYKFECQHCVEVLLEHFGHFVLATPYHFDIEVVLTQKRHDYAWMP